MTFGGIEAGGTKFVVATGTGPSDISNPVRFATTDPDSTIARAVEVLAAGAGIESLGVATFGPVDLAEGSGTFGTITTTPKPGWQGVDLRGRLEGHLGVPVAIDTDVNGAALGERRWGAARGLHSFWYLTVGTGIGGGGMVDGDLVHGLSHPEIGHVRIPRHRDDDLIGICPYHADCLEGLASGPAIEARFGTPGEALGEQLARAVEIEAWYLGTALANLTLTAAPQRIILGGGVMKLPGLIEAVRLRFAETLNGYVAHAAVDATDTYIVPPALGDRAGVLGAIALAERLGARASGT